MAHQLQTESPFSKLLSALGLSDLHGGKLTLSSVLEINRNTVSDQPLQDLKDLPWTFLKELMLANINARNMNYSDPSAHVDGSTLSNFTDEIISNDDLMINAVNPLDLITALFHCSDPFLQQEMVSKMSICQFAVPMLLPNHGTKQSTLALWAMRDIIKKYRPHSLTGEKTFVEGRVVEMDIPMVSFVRLGESSLPKSQILNKLLSDPNQHNDAFVHHDMECGDVLRRISDGLVEISWYLPCGNTKIDMFTEPVAIANLRGNGRLFQTQVSFLCQTSAAVFIFCDDLKGDLNIISNRENKAELFLVTNSQRNKFNIKTLKEACKKHNITEQNVIIKKRQNDAEFVKGLRQHVNGLIKRHLHQLKVENMAVVARKLEIQVDEDVPDCLNGRKNAERITQCITNVVEFKEMQLPMHGNIWKEISQMEKERCRLKNVPRDQDIEQYKSSLVSQEEDLRKKQYQKDLSDAMVKFMIGVSQSPTERLYFLKWLKIQLDNLSRHNLAELREKYKDCCRNTPQNKKLISQLDKDISNCSLGPEHFFRELGQLYESACSLPETDQARQQVQHLPALCAQMLLDGFPVELVDGDASNIPMKWVSEVLGQLHKLVDCKSRILVLTVLGVQSTGKSTLLNTMFGVQFAVSSGRCTRGAFMLLIKVSDDLRSELKCDFLMVIDTEGLKSPELAALDTSYEHDNELATLVIGLSDITIINIAMENNQEMRDILQIVVHAFLRMREVGKMPRCVFVHQNVSDMSAHDSNMRDRKKLVEQLDEMTQAAAKMEKKEANMKFSDVMVYDPDKDSYYIPGLWHGTPPMAPVNAGYSEAVYKLKKSLIDFRPTSDESNDATEFLKWTESLWNAVKFENFIFNFRNSLVADAYAHLCTEYNKWEWSFQKEMNNWLIIKEAEISNFGVTGQNIHMDSLQKRLREMLTEASEKLNNEEKKILNNLEGYFGKKDRKVNLVEKYRQDFRTSATSLRRGTEISMKEALVRDVQIKEGMEKVNKIKNMQFDTIEANVRKLLQECKERKEDLSTENLSREFEIMWEGIMAKLSNVGLPKTDVYTDVLYLLKNNLATKRANITELFKTVNLRESGYGSFVVKSDWFSNWTSSAKKVISAITHFNQNYFISKIQMLCEVIIAQCSDLISTCIETMKRNNTDYHEMYIKDILKTIDDALDHKITAECEANLKLYICGQAARLFSEAHEEFNNRNDPKKCLMKCQSIFLNKFLQSFREKDHQQKAADFMDFCLGPAVRRYVLQHLGQAIADYMKMDVTYKTPEELQFAILQYLLQEHSFEEYKDYITSYETFVKDWMKEDIIQKMLGNGRLTELEKDILSGIIRKINDAINSISKNGDMKVFIETFCATIKDHLIFPQDVLRTFLSFNEAKADQFATNLIELVKKMEQSKAKEYNNKTSISERIEELPCKPHELLFISLCACGHQCPFCGAPCEAGGMGHTTHFSNMHRPVGLKHSTHEQCGETTSNKLTTDICTSLVQTDEQGFWTSVLFSVVLVTMVPVLFTLTSAMTLYRRLVPLKYQGFNDETNGKLILYKNYRTAYPDWDIPGNSNYSASAYWKYVLRTFNREFADVYKAKPADIPKIWNKITKSQAKASLKESFNKK